MSEGMESISQELLEELWEDWVSFQGEFIEFVKWVKEKQSEWMNEGGTNKRIQPPQEQEKVNK